MNIAANPEPENDIVAFRREIPDHKDVIKGAHLLRDDRPEAVGRDVGDDPLAVLRELVGPGRMPGYLISCLLASRARRGRTRMPLSRLKDEYLVQDGVLDD